VCLVCSYDLDQLDIPLQARCNSFDSPRWLTTSSHLIQAHVMPKPHHERSAGKPVRLSISWDGGTVSGWKEAPNAGDEVLTGQNWT